jgi:hypothetical protein
MKEYPRKIKHELETGLRKLIESAEDSRKWVPESENNDAAHTIRTLNEIHEGYHKIDRLIETYDFWRDPIPSLKRKFPRDRVYAAGVTCFEDLNKRWDALFSHAIENKFLTPEQQQEVNRWKERANISITRTQ